MSTKSTHRILHEFINVCGRTAETVEPSSQSERLKDTSNNNVSSFKSLNQEFIWSESLEGWIKAEKNLTSIRVVPPEYKCSDLQFLTGLQEIVEKELKRKDINVNSFREVEAGLDVSYLCTMVPGGQFVDMRVYFFLKQGRILFIRKNHTYDAELSSLLVSDSSLDTVRNIEAGHLEAKITFLQSQPLLWLQFLTPKRSFFARCQKYTVILFKNQQDRDLVQNINRVVLHTSYIKFQKKYGVTPKKGVSGDI